MFVQSFDKSDVSILQVGLVVGLWSGLESGIAFWSLPMDRQLFSEILSHVVGFQGLNMAIILFSEQWFTFCGPVFNLNFVQSSVLSALIKARSNKNPTIFCSQSPILPGLTWLYLKLPGLDPTCIFAFRHNTSMYACQVHPSDSFLFRSY